MKECINIERVKRWDSSDTISYSDVEYFFETFRKLSICFFENFLSYIISISLASFIFYAQLVCEDNFILARINI